MGSGHEMLGLWRCTGREKPRRILHVHTTVLPFLNVSPVCTEYRHLLDHSYAAGGSGPGCRGGYGLSTGGIPTFSAIDLTCQSRMQTVSVMFGIRIEN